MTEVIVVIVVIGAGSIGQAIARRVSAGKHVVLADLRIDNADAEVDLFRSAGFDVTTVTVDVSSRESVQALVQTATNIGDVTGLIHAAGVSPGQASRSTSTAPPSSSKNSGTSSPQAAPGSSSPHSLAIASAPSLPNRIAPSPPHRPRNSSPCPCCNEARSPTHSTLSNSPNAATRCA